MKSRCLVVLLVLLAIAGCGKTVTHTVTTPSVAPPSATGSVHPPEWGRPAPEAAHPFGLKPAATAALYDTVTLSTVPRAPFALAGYTAGFWPTFLPLRRAYPTAHVVSIAISAGYRADCLDVEPGDATPFEVPVWVRAEKRAGWSKPCVYSDWSEYHNEIAPTLIRAGIKRANVYEWDADYTNVPHIDEGFDATQWTDRALGRNLDESLVLRSFLSLAHPPLVPAPKPKPKPSPSKRRAELKALLGAYSKRNPRGHNCQKSRYRHAYPNARYNRACLAWAQEVKN